jgi:hypothetical protein
MISTKRESLPKEYIFLEVLTQLFFVATNIMKINIKKIFKIKPLLAFFI